MSKATRKETRGFAMVLGYLGLFMILIGIITTIPLFMCFYPGESECWMDFVIPAGINVVLGLLLYFCFLFICFFDAIRVFANDIFLSSF